MAIDTTNLCSESDVEHKVIWPLLTDGSPMGLTLSPKDIFTKASIKSITIDKGRSKKNYFPDYVYVNSGVPLLVVEAKAPGEDLDEAMREARLYAGELNARFGQQADPVKYIIACDGHRLLAGLHNDEVPLFDISSAEFSPVNVKFAKFLALFGFNSINKWGDEVIRKMRPKRYWKPRKLVGGLAAQSEEIGLNSFGTTIKSDFRGLFDPANIAERDVIASECYIASKRRDRYIDSIDRTFQAIIPPSEKIAAPIDDTSRPDQIISKLRQGSKLTNQVMLLIGAAGAGKTTFIDHLRVKALPRDVRSKTIWIHLNMNAAPVSAGEIYSWLRAEIIDGIQSHSPRMDFYELDNLKKIFRVDLERFRKGVGRLYEKNPEKHDEKLAEVISGCLENHHYTAQAFCKYVSSRYSALVVFVLDNCDKRLMDEQLLMFEAAQWLRTEFEAMIFLPLREETYDKNLSIPPLDTALKDLAFRIEPPRFDLILRSRVDYAIRKLRENPTQKFSYDLPNSMRATYTAADKVSYLTSILKSVFDSDSNIRRLLIGLSGRNMRRAMEIFLEFCSSGHISEDEVVKMVQSRGAYSLPMPLVSRVILRSKKRYYDSDHSYVVNLFSADIDDKRPNFFVRACILRHLAGIAHDGQSARIAGYTKGESILEDVRRFGIDEHMVVRELNYLAKSHCIVSEDFRMVGITLDDLITISPAGRTHLHMIGNIHYIAAIAEDTWFRDAAVAQSITDRIKNPSIHLDNRTSLANAKSVVSFLEVEAKEAIAEFEALFPDMDAMELVSASSLQKTVHEREKQMVGKWVGADSRFAVGTEVIGRVSNKVRYGLFVEFEPGISGLLHVSRATQEDLAKEVDDTITVKVSSIDVFEEKMSLQSCSR